MKSRPVMVTTTNATSTPGKRTLFRIALAVALVGSIAVSTILFVQGGLAFGRLRYFVDIGLHPLHVTSTVLIIFGLLSLLSFITLTLGIVKVNKTFSVVAAVLLGVCSLGLIAFSIWSFLTMTGGRLSTSINNAIVKELDQTQYSITTGNTINIENTHKMSRLEKQHECCGLTDPLEDYRNRQPAAFDSLNPSSSSSGGTGGGAGSARGRTSTQRNSASSRSTVQLPISCCNEKYRSADGSCIDMFGNNTNPLNRYNNVGCFGIIAQNKFERIQRQGITTVIAACISVISCVALAAVVRLLGEGYQIIPVRTAT